MPKMESKKLQTIINAHGVPMIPSGVDYLNRLHVALENDARIAHEQREVIRKLVDSMYPIACNCPEHVEKREAALTAAAPYLLED